jgi:hypothetical protein
MSIGENPMARDDSVRVRLTQGEKALLLSRAKKQQRTLSSYCRMILLNVTLKAPKKGLMP